MRESNLLIKITRPEDPELQSKARWFAGQPGINSYLSLAETKSGLQNEAFHESRSEVPILHITRKGTYLLTDEESLTFHPSMALLRLMQIIRGEEDRFLKAVALEEGDTFLDGTLGLGTDALIAAFQVGDRGKVIGVEYSSVLAAIVKDGLNNLALGKFPPVKNPKKREAWQKLGEASPRINIRWGSHYEILAQMPSQSVDVVYFDPMFRRTREESASIRPLQEISYQEPISLNTIEEAKRVARKRIVLKERKFSKEFDRLGFTIEDGGKYSHIDYGIIQLKGSVM
ncbi:MAG: class I SAM-dependent methyltransferase [Desulfitobacterium sp.]|nr:class I SAM-dependent methyltransferase [Desulfitobacterium sp.]